MAALVLIIGNDKGCVELNRKKLSKEGFMVAVCTSNRDISSRIDKVKPDVVLINSTTVNNQSTDIYNTLIDNVRYAALPVIFTLSDNDVYLVNRKRTAMPDKKSIIASTAIDAVHQALEKTRREKRADLSFREFRMMYRA